ncbi:hypothetical protein FisN_6Lh013 [Fistulifera solaris]|uniref:HSF-type DNA-binding domain-containing protein n=1 Tax=Fistulifera solaris TaxID=1519565 RepID=A0A1Z5KQ68_FISSO|nr:hypothetical protein FisN_6Lh013 [Fistulifera solaris]|eukprot:GAX28161.1 hypothetical protein FisN_6Lh013 [Fistulifera solaris]
MAYFPFPRTGKRGVPQQFPRRLFEMLEGETKLMELDPVNHHQIISWSDSGKAFKIHNITAFAETILPKYFRTTKHSSFQRNLNLYGFTKVRRGPETDMYAHPSFLRYEPESLVHLRKVTTTDRKRWESATVLTPDMRSVSPTHSSSSAASTVKHTAPLPPMMPQWTLHHNNRVPDTLTFTISPPNKSCDRGKLDLLALAMEQEFAAATTAGVLPMLHT